MTGSTAERGEQRASALHQRRLDVDGQVFFPWRFDALEMIAAGALQGIEAIFATHVDPTREVGRIGIRAGMLTANCDAMRLVIEGRGGHAARPHESNDPIAAAAQLISTLYLFVPRATDSQDAVVITIGKVDGGNNPKGN